MAEHLAAKGVDVLGTYHTNREEAETVAKQLRAAGATAHFEAFDAAAIETYEDFAARVRTALAEHFSGRPLTYLVNNAGVGAHAAFAKTTEEQLDRLFAIHVKAPYLVTQALLPDLADGGKILNVSSGLARFALPGYSAYGAMKGAIEVVTRYQAKELGERGITANTLAPGAIATDFGGGVVRDDEQVNQLISSQIALGRVGEAEDIGAAAAALLVDAGTWINAQRIEVSGGQLI